MLSYPSPMAKDAVERKHDFEEEHPDVEFAVEPGYWHRATYVDPKTGETETTQGFMWLGDLLNHLQRKFGG
jgi:hypothetical protein